MSDYRLYCLNDDGKIKEASWIEAKSDDEALIMVRAKKLPTECELWLGNSLISRISPHLR